jgi:hypothetical protein
MLVAKIEIKNRIFDHFQLCYFTLTRIYAIFYKKKLFHFQTRPQNSCELYIGEKMGWIWLIHMLWHSEQIYYTLFLTSQFSQLYMTVTACGAQNTDMINLFIIVLYLCFHSGFCVPPIHQELPRLDGFSSKLIFHRILLLDAWGFNCRV